ncbi:two-component regulator propeller domain-containing protein [Mucilaginibacter sp. AW1-7]|uniref:two-component regulator propeller domain-containing protein n=1 Tax=Mucilaginibacter sp. AW1-7 TaxID=3349874 RepID=UPI003F73CE8D
MWKWIKCCFFVLLFTVTVQFSAAAQDAIKFTTITVQEGLSSNTVNAIIKDRNGLMWFATTNGLGKFDGSAFTTYRHEPADQYSLPSNEVLTLFEGRQGRIWIGTSGGGLCYYDQKYDRFVNYKGDGSWKELSGISARAILEDHKGQLWVGTYGDLRKFDLKTGKVGEPVLPKPLLSNMETFVILCLYEDREHRIWAGTNSGLFLYEPAKGKFHKFEHQADVPSSLSDNAVKAIMEDKQGNLWFATLDGLSKWLGNGRFMIYRHDPRRSRSLSNNAVCTLALDREGKLWVGTEDGVNILNQATADFHKVGPNPRDIFSLKSRYIRSFFYDPKGIFWVGTLGGGVSKYNQQLSLFDLKRSDAFDPAGLKSPFVTSFAAYRNDKIFIGTDGGGLQLFDKVSGLFKTYPISSKLDRSQELTIAALHLDISGQLWAGTHYHGLFRIDPVSGTFKQFIFDGSARGPGYNSITTFTEDPNGRLWMGTIGHGISIYDPKTQLFTNFDKYSAAGFRQVLPLNGYINALAIQPDGDIWIASSGTGIAVCHAGNGSITHYNKANSGLADDVVIDLLVARDGTLWAGTNQGISCFDPKTKRFNSYTEHDGLGNNFVKNIQEDDHGLLWLSTDRGISAFDRKKKTFRNFTSENGVQSSSFLNGSGLKTPDGDLFFGGQDGFNYLNPAKLPPPQVPGPVLFNELKIGNVPVTPGSDAPITEQITTASEIRLRYGQNFSIGYVATDYTSPKQDLYAYRLLGFEKEWNYVRKARVANYTNLDPGTYVFQVMATKNERDWSNAISEIKVTVQPPFWRTIYAYVAYVILGGSVLLLIRRRGIRKLQRQFQITQEKLKAEQLIEQERLQAERLHQLDQSKIKFLTDLSHEFRTPISLILAPVEKLLERSFKEDDATHLKMVSRNVKRLLNLVNQLLDFRKMEEHELKLNLMPDDIIQFILEATESFVDVADRKQIIFHVTTKQQHWQTLFDHDKLEKVIFNLLSNAFKFTPRGGSVDLYLDISEPTGASAVLEIRVADSGVGIAENELDKIFERFYQADPNGKILNQGTGIGLAIAKEFVELHHGHIHASGKPTGGSVFFITLPVMQLPEPASQNEPAALPATSVAMDLIPNSFHIDEDSNTNKLPTVLLVEDNDEFRFYLAGHLKQHYRIVESVNGREGWQKALSTHPELVVSDISMPEMNGIELCKKIKGDKRTSHIPVILLTAMTGEEDQLKGLQTGANDYMSKPFNFQILQTKISNLLLLNKKLKATYSKQIQLTGTEIACESADVKLLNTIMKWVEDQLSDSELSVEELSRHVGMSRGSLYYKLLEITGLSPVEYIRTIRLDKARALLEASDFNVAQIAYMTGFGTPSYFSKNFKKKYGLSPSEFLTGRRAKRSKNLLTEIAD